jgi:hypothetical protein
MTEGHDRGIGAGAGIVPAIVVCLLVGAVLLLAHETGGSQRRTADVSTVRSGTVVRGPVQARLAIAGNASLSAIPRSFFGLSTEYSTLPVDEFHRRLYARAISYLHVAGDGPFVLRIGGDSSDHALFDPSIHRLPR